MTAAVGDASMGTVAFAETLRAVAGMLAPTAVPDAADGGVLVIGAVATAGADARGVTAEDVSVV